MNKKTNKMNKMLGGREQEANSMVNTPSGETFADRYINALTNTAKKISQQIQNISGTAASKISDVASSANNVVYDAATTASKGIGSV